MEIDQFMPNDDTIAAIEKDVAIYNQRRSHEATRLKLRRPAIITIYMIVLIVFAYATFRAAGGFHWLHGLLLGLGFGLWPSIDRWIRADATWTQQRFRDHLLPVMFGFIRDFRYEHGITPRGFHRMPRELVPGHNKRSFDDVLAGTLEGGRFELCEMKLVQTSKNSETVMFQGALLHCRLGSPFPGTLIATRRIGDFKRFFRDLFSRGSLSEIISGESRLDELYEFRTDRRTEARRLLAGPLGGMLGALWRQWPGDTAQVGIRNVDVFIMLPTSRNFFELPPIDTEITYHSDLAPMMRQIARFLSIAAMVPGLEGALPGDADAGPATPPGESTLAAAVPASEPDPEIEASTAAEDFVPLLDPVESPRKPDHNGKT